MPNLSASECHNQWPVFIPHQIAVTIIITMNLNPLSSLVVDQSSGEEWGFILRNVAGDRV